MRTVIDATALPAERMGAGRYVLELIASLDARDDVDLNVMVKQRDRDDVARIAPRACVHAVALRTRPARLLWEQTLLPGRARRLKPDVFHGPHYTAPPGLDCPAVVTFHDPTFFTNPELHERSKVAYFTRMARVGARRATRLIAVSEYAKRGAVEHAGANPDRVDVVHEGIDLATHRPDAPDPVLDQRLRDRLGARRPYLFWVGAIEPRKDLPALVRAFAALVRQGAGHMLVLAGGRRWGASQLDDAVAASGVSDRILRPGYITDEEKIALYRGADALVYPSIAEGFGRQVVEAMACGCPVITTTGSAPEEIGGEAAVLVAPGDAGALRHAVERVVSDPDLAQQLRRRGLERASAFSLDAEAERTVAVYRRAVAGS